MRQVKCMAAVFIILALLAPGAFAENKTFPIGAFWAMTGPQAYYGRVMSQGARTGIEHVNQAGGVAGYNLDLIITDFKNVDTNLAVSGVRKMIDVDKIPVVLASFSATSLAVQPICSKNEVLMLNGGGYSPMLANKAFLYNTRMSQDQMMPGLLKFYWDQGIRKLAVIYMSDPAGEVPANEVIKPLWTSWGGEVVALAPHQPGLTDFSTYMARIRAKQPDAIIDISTGLDVPYIVKAAREMGMNMPMSVPEWSDDYQAVAGQHSQNVYVAVEQFNPDIDDPLTQKFVNDYTKKWNEKPDFYAANYYDATANIIPELMRRVEAKGGDPMSGKALNDAIWENPTFKTVFGGDLTLSRDGTVVKPLAIYKIENGKQVFIQNVKPAEVKTMERQKK